MSENEKERFSQAEEPELIVDPDERAAKEARNGLLQFDHAMQVIETALNPERPFKLRPSLLLQLNRIAIEGLSSFAGVYRPGGVEIKGSRHNPPQAHLVPELTEDMCDYVNANWGTKSAYHLSSYMMWRLNWIHPFVDGNGRTARMSSYVVLCAKLGARLPGTKTIPEQIAANKTPYYDALEAADEAQRNGNIDLSVMEELLSSLLASQLYELHESAKKDAIS